MRDIFNIWTRKSHPAVCRTANPFRSLFGVLVAAVMVCGITPHVSAQAAAALPPPGEGDFHPERILIKPLAGVAASVLSQFHAGNGSQVLRTFTQMEGIQVLRLAPGASVPEMITNYLQSGLVEFAEPDFRLHLAAEPNDPRYADGSLWHLHNTGQSGGVVDADIDGREGWDTMRYATNIIVAIVDTGVRYTHEDLAANMWVNPGEIAGNGIDDDGNGYIDDVHGINAAANDGNPIDLHGHGTQVAGLAGAVGNNGKGGTGVAWSVQLMALRFFDDAGTGYTSDAAECIDYARLRGAHIINASFGSPSSSSTMSSAISSARNAGIILVAAAANDSSDNDSKPVYPASYTHDNIVAVAATTRTDALASYSNYGATSVDLGAPGSDLYTTARSSDTAYTKGSGTSFAAPVTAGAFALMKARYPHETYRQLIDRVYAAVDPQPSLAGKTVTGGRLNLANALGPALLADFTASRFSGELPLTVDFTDLSFGAITSWTWDFGDGNSSAAQHPSHTFNQAGRFTVRLTVANGAGQTSASTATINVVANYQIQAATFNWIDPLGMTALSLTDNGVSAAQALPFTFNYYGQDYAAIYVSANGMVGFVPDGLSAHNNVELPNAALPNAMLCPWWDDLDPGGGGSVHVGVTGSSPNRRFVVSWVGVPHRSPGKKASFTFQAVLEEGTRRIVFQYLSVDASHSLGAGKSATIGVENQAGTVAARYSYNGSTLLQNNQAIAFVPASAPAMSITPSDAFVSGGTTGGPFSPASQGYTVSNTGTASLNWQATATVGWLSLTPASGTLAPGGSASVTVSLNANANSLPAGLHGDTITFANLDNGAGNTTRTVSLTVEGVGVLAVTPADDLNASGVVGGPFSPSSQDYVLTNTGDGTLGWAVSKTATWISLSATSGQLLPGASATVTVSLNAAAHDLAAGSYGDKVTFANTSNGNGDTTRSVNLTVEPPPGVLAVASSDGLNASGVTGGPFTPGSKTYTLSNTGGTSLDWTAAKSVNWLSLSATGGTLAAGASVEVTVSFNAAANDLTPGSYGDTITFANTSNGDGNTTRTVSLTVNPTPGELSLLSVAAFQSSGFTGGPFDPEQQIYELKNDGGSSLDWAAGSEQAWLEASPSGGTLAPGEQVSVTVQLAAAANELPAGMHAGVMRFIDPADPDTKHDISATLEVYARARLQVEPQAGSFLLTVTGHPGHRYVVELSGDFQNWTPVHTNVLDFHGVFQYLHTDVDPSGLRSFRALWQP
jgi:PKD repeat protein